MATLGPAAQCCNMLHIKAQAAPRSAGNGFYSLRVLTW